MVLKKLLLHKLNMCLAHAGRGDSLFKARYPSSTYSFMLHFPIALFDLPKAVKYTH